MRLRLWHCQLGHHEIIYIPALNSTSLSPSRVITSTQGTPGCTDTLLWRFSRGTDTLHSRHLRELQLSSSLEIIGEEGGKNEACLGSSRLLPLATHGPSDARLPSL